LYEAENLSARSGRRSGIGGAGGWCGPRHNYRSRTASAAAQDEPGHAQAIVNTYLNALNAGMASGTCDFSALSSIYAADATVIATGGPFSPGGPFGAGGSYGQQEFHGTTAILGFYTKLCGIVSHLGVAKWTRDTAFLLSPNVLNSYEHVTFSGQGMGRCMHVFTISGNHITSLNWSVYG
jgi:hypothetical protein